jgi:hypothetical protein
MMQPASRRRRFARPGGWLPLLILGLSLLSGCNALHLGRPSDDSTSAVASAPATPPGKYAVRVSQYVFYSDFPVKQDLPLFRELAEMRDQIYKELQLPQANTVVQVFLFEDEERYQRYMRARYPDLIKRRAFFIAQPRTRGGVDELLVFAFWGDHVRQDLRHELTHGLLHSVLKDVPLWLDEGLAEFFELPPERNGINAQHLEQLRHGPFQPDMARLEQLSQVQHMERAEYREAWAWVHLMLRDKPEGRAVLLNYLQLLRANPTPGSLLAKLREVYPSPNETLTEHLTQIEPERPANPVAARQ